MEQKPWGSAAGVEPVTEARGKDRLGMVKKMASQWFNWLAIF